MRREDQRCGNCDAFSTRGPGSMGMCRALPPKVFLVMQQNPLNSKDVQPSAVGFYPPQHEQNWCRAWEASPNASARFGEALVPQGESMSIAARPTNGSGGN